LWSFKGFGKSVDGEFSMPNFDAVFKGFEFNGAEVFQYEIKDISDFEVLTFL
jgi:hypothetical protein